MTTITAQTVLRSRNAAAPEKVLSTLLLRYPRFIHAEVLTHRAFSRNAASSRAIPFEKQLAAMMADPAVPLHIGAEQKGMQAHEELDEAKRAAVEGNWLNAMEEAAAWAKSLHDLGAHKQVVNRIIEPFTHITVLVSATEWGNFLELRDHPDAEPHIQMLAREVRKCLEDESTVQTLQPGEWHLPFVTGYRAAADPVDAASTEYELRGEPVESAIKLSTARCASTSYKTVDGFDMTLGRAIALHDKLVSSRPIHASPAEHVAQVDGYGLLGHGWDRPHQHRNFVGFRQYRAMLDA